MMERTLSAWVKRAVHEATAPLLRPLYTGIGSILMFHRVVDPPPGVRAGWPRGLEITPAQLHDLVSRLRRTGHALVSLDELREALVLGGKRREKLVVVTIDDGYRDTYDTAFPLLTGLGVPFTFYVTTDYPDRKMVPWWVLLERHLTRGERVSIRLGDGAISFRLDTQTARDRAFLEVARRFEEAPASARRGMAEEAFGEGEVARAVEELSIRWDQVEEMAAHPLVTIGAHTVTHPILRDLPREAARVEMVESRRRLEARLGQPVHHFAYPHGSPAQVGEREYALARECGFTTAVTTRLANVMPESGDHLECLPRIYGESVRELELGLSGVVSAFRYRGRRVVTV